MHVECEARRPSQELVHSRMFDEEGIVKMSMLNANPKRTGPDIEKRRHLKPAPVIEEIFESDIVIADDVINVQALRRKRFESVKNFPERRGRFLKMKLEQFRNRRR